MAKKLTSAEINKLMNDADSIVFRKGIFDIAFLFFVIAIFMLSGLSMLLIAGHVWLYWLPITIFATTISCEILSRRKKALIIHPNGIFLPVAELDNRPQVQSLENLFVQWEELTRLALRSRIVKDANSRYIMGGIAFAPVHDEICGCQLMFATRSIKAPHVFQLDGILSEFDSNKRKKIVKAISGCGRLPYRELRNPKFASYWCYEFGYAKPVRDVDRISEQDWQQL